MKDKDAGSLTQKLKNRYSSLWGDMTNHPFVDEMGKGALPAVKFRRYFLQDYVFVNDLVALTAQAIAKSPNLKVASLFTDFLIGILDPENDLFLRAFDELGVSEEEYTSVRATPTTRAFGDFIVRTALEGDFDDIAVLLYVTEGTYLEWGTRLLKDRANPDIPIYREWIDLHGPKVLGGLVQWLEDYIDNASQISEDRADYIFHMSLRYEYLFWEAAYEGEGWFDD